MMAHHDLTLEAREMDHPANASFGIDADDPLFYVCWRRQSCGWCLEGDAACSWCAVTSTCVPNPAHFPILAPLGSSQLCPLGSKERWELRALPFGCNVSTITFLTAVGSVLSTLVAIALGIVAIWAVKRAPGWWGRRKLSRGRWRERIRGRGRAREGCDREEAGDAERRPLLGRDLQGGVGNRGS